MISTGQWLRRSVSSTVVLVCAWTLVESSARVEASEIGPFVLSDSLEQAGWSREDPSQVLGLLVAEGVEEPASVLWTSPRGSRVYGMFWESMTGAITAEKIVPSVLPPTWFDEWGLERGAVSARLARDPFPAGITAVWIEATGDGEGLRFRPDGPDRIAGTWVLLPVVFEDGEGLRLGIVRLFLRGGVATVDEQDRADFLTFLGGLSLWAPIHTPREFYMFRGELDWRKQGEPAKVVLTPERAAIPPAKVPETGPLVHALGRALGRDASDADERDEAIRFLGDRLPGNPRLGEEMERARREGAEHAWIEQALSADSDGSARRELVSFHRQLLEIVRSESGIDGADAYLAYLDRVWPGNGISRPPGSGEAGVSWVHPGLGIEMERLPGETGRWMSRLPIDRSLVSRATENRTDNGVTWREARALVERFGLRLPSPEEYKKAAGTLREGRPFWATSSTGGGPLAIWVDQGGLAREKVRAGRDARAAFLVVLEE